MARRGRCPDCRISLFDEVGRCSKCDGTGVNTQVSSAQADCPYCNGTGVCAACGGTGFYGGEPGRIQTLFGGE